MASEKEKKIEQNKNFDFFLTIGLANLYFFEHIKDLYYKYREDNRPVSFITPALYPFNKRKKELFDYFENELLLNFGTDIIPFPYVKYIHSEKYLECSVSSYCTDKRCKKFIYVHGLGGLGFGKDYEFIKYIKFYDGILLAGPMQKKAIEVAAKIYNVKLPVMYEVGYLRGDRLLYQSEHFDKNNFLQKFNLEKGIPVALYTPTWGEFASVKEWIDKVVNVCSRLGVYLFIKLHPLMMTEKSKDKTCGINWKQKLNELIKKSSYVRIWESQNLDEIMIASDFMITDVSGMAMEYMVLEKPVVFLPAPKFFKIFGENRPEKWCRPIKEIDNEKELYIKLIRALNYNEFIYPIDNLIYNKKKSLSKIREILG